jgi:hypothetical protein
MEATNVPTILTRLLAQMYGFLLILLQSITMTL